MWKAIFDANLVATHWVLASDFNMLEDVHKINLVGNKFMKQREVAIWHCMTIS